MKNLIIFPTFYILLSPAANPKEIGPAGFIFLIVVLMIAIVVSLFFVREWFGKNKNYTRFRKVRKKTSVEVRLTKNRLYFPDFLTLIVKNTGSDDVDIERPLMIFESLLMNRKFRLKGIDSYHFYPLYLEAGKEHSLRIDLGKFYQHDRRLKRFPQVTIFISSVQGKKLGKKSIMLRKTFFR